MINLGLFTDILMLIKLNGYICKNNMYIYTVKLYKPLKTNLLRKSVKQYAKKYILHKIIPNVHKLEKFNTNVKFLQSIT